MSALDTQVGGNHYKQFAIQPMDFITKNKLGYREGNVIKYVTRHPFKNGVEDLYKARHYLDVMIEEYEQDAKVMAEPETIYLPAGEAIEETDEDWRPDMVGFHYSAMKALLDNIHILYGVPKKDCEALHTVIGMYCDAELEARA